MEFWASDQVKDAIEAFPVPGSATTRALELSFGINTNVDDERFELLNEFVKYMLLDRQVNAAIVRGSSGTPNLKGLQVEYRPGSAGHARLLTPPEAFEDLISRMLEDWEGLGGTKPTAEVLADAATAALAVDLSGLMVMEDRFR